MVLGWTAPVPATSFGYVDLQHALILSVPAVFTARLGVWVAHRINTQALRRSFAVLAFIVAIRILLRVM